MDIHQELEILSDRIEEYFFRKGIFVFVSRAIEGARIYQFTILCDPLEVKSVLKEREGLSYKLKTDPRRVRFFQKEGYLSLEMPSKKPRVVYYEDIIRRLRIIPEGRRALAKPLNMVAGITPAGEPILIKPRPHFLLVGETGTGKSELFKTMVFSAMSRSLPENLKFIFIDTKGSTFSIFEKAKDYLLYPPIYEVKEAVLVLEEIISEMRRRIEKKDKPYRVMICIEETADFLLDNEEGQKIIEKLLSVSRALDFTIGLATQHAVSKVLGTLSKVNVPTRIVGKVTSAFASSCATGQVGIGCERLSKPAEFIVIDGSEQERFTACLTKDKTITSFLERLTDRPETKEKEIIEQIRRVVSSEKSIIPFELTEILKKEEGLSVSVLVSKGIAQRKARDWMQLLTELKIVPPFERGSNEPRPIDKKRVCQILEGMSGVLEGMSTEQKGRIYLIK